MRVLLIGAKGQVGWELQRSLAPWTDLIAVDFPEIDLARPDTIRHWLDRAQPGAIINAAAYTAVDQAESDLDRATAINAIAPGLLAEEARLRGAWLVHYSTDYVFPGTTTRPYAESDPAGPVNHYGHSKLAGDLAVQAANGRHLIFRLCWVYGLRGRNFLLTLQRLAREQERLRVVHDQFGSPTWCRPIADATALALHTATNSPDPDAFSGLYHLACSSHTSWHGFAEAIVARLPESERRCLAVDPIPSAEYPTPARRPAWSVLDCTKLHRTFGLRLPPWDHTLALALER
ncbi:MAG: dTDP-4-dehydrorhamnose reductase [Verrucomicrobiae bacterium]|nr:dTDP-4-dehydrorhamnose reductase [Verrucomicrobiae bacterium]